MPNEIYRKNVITMINRAIREYRDAVEINHPGIKGHIREIAIRKKRGHPLELEH